MLRMPTRIRRRRRACCCGRWPGVGTWLPFGSPPAQRSRRTFGTGFGCFPSRWSTWTRRTSSRRSSPSSVRTSSSRTCRGRGSKRARSTWPRTAWPGFTGRDRTGPTPLADRRSQRLLAEQSRTRSRLAPNRGCRRSAAWTPRCAAWKTRPRFWTSCAS